MLAPDIIITIVPTLVGSIKYLENQSVNCYNVIPKAILVRAFIAFYTDSGVFLVWAFGA